MWLWQHGGDVLCGETGPRLPAVVLASSRVAAGAGTGGSNLRYVWRQQRQDNYLFPFLHPPKPYLYAHTHSFSLFCFFFPVQSTLDSIFRIEAQSSVMSGKHKL